MKRINSINLVNIIDFNGWFEAKGEVPTAERVAALAVPLIAHFEVELYDGSLEQSQAQLKGVDEYMVALEGMEIDAEDMSKLRLMKWMAQQGVRIHKARLGLL